MIACVRQAAHRLGLDTFRRLPVPWRRRLQRAGTPTWTAGAVVVLRDSAGQVLLLRSRHHSGWGLPGGLLKRGEDPLAAALREVREEIGVRLQPADLSCGSRNAQFDGGSRQVTAVFGAALDDAAVAGLRGDGTEIVDLAWFAADALPTALVRGTRESLDCAGR